MAFQEKRQQILPDDTRMTIKFDGNDDTSSSGCSTPDLSLKINDGRSLTLAEFVEHIETQTGQVVREVCIVCIQNICVHIFYFRCMLAFIVDLLECPFLHLY